MSLFQSSLVTGVILSVIGILAIKPNVKVRASFLAFPRSKNLSTIFIGIATAWFLVRHVAFLGEADFGSYKILIGTIALGTSILSFIFVPDFLAVRGLAMIILLWSREVLDSAFLQDASSRLFLVSVIYLLILSSIYFGAWPYKMRDFMEWLMKRNNRISTLGSFLGIAGILIVILSFSY